MQGQVTGHNQPSSYSHKDGLDKRIATRFHEDSIVRRAQRRTLLQISIAKSLVSEPKNNFVKQKSSLMDMFYKLVISVSVVLIQLSSLRIRGTCGVWVSKKRLQQIFQIS